MKRKAAKFLTIIALLATASNIAFGANNQGKGDVSAIEQKGNIGKVSTIILDEGTMTIYDHGKIKLHTYATGDALNDGAYIIEGQDALVGIELPSFTKIWNHGKNISPH